MLLSMPAASQRHAHAGGSEQPTVGCNLTLHVGTKSTTCYSIPIYAQRCNATFVKYEGNKHPAQIMAVHHQCIYAFVTEQFLQGACTISVTIHHEDLCTCQQDNGHKRRSCHKLPQHSISRLCTKRPEILTESDNPIFAKDNTNNTNHDITWKTNNPEK